ncbi:MAG: hypothetical protein HAW61_03885 [Candidatus Portiera sp.]|nr:hypothetical protein [Portiera sp.]
MAKDNKLKQVITKVIVRILIWCVSTLRYDRNQRPTKPCIVALWHEDISTACRFFSNYDAVTLASPSRDAENLSVPVLIANNITLLRYTASKPDLATQGIYKMLQFKGNYCLGLTIDGPTGPRRQAKAGVLILAARLGIPLYACRFSYRHFRLKSSWDKTKIPLPFTKIHAHISEPILLNRKSNIRSELAKLDKLMLELGDD